MTRSSTRSRPRWPRVLLLTISLAWTGLLGGAAVGATCCVPAGSGLAGPAIALGYGLLGAALGVALALLLGWKASREILHLALLLSAILAFFATGVLAYRVAGRWSGRAENYSGGSAGSSVRVAAR